MGELEKKDIEPVVEPSPEEVDVSEMSLEEIDALEKKENEKVAEPEKEATVEPEKPVEDKVDKPEPDKKEVDPEKRVKDLQGIATKAQQEAADLRRKVAKLQSDLDQAKKTSFERLDEEALEELKESDADAYIEYKDAEKKHDQEVADAEAKALDAIVNLQVDEVSNFIKKRFNIDFDIQVPYDKQPDEAKALIDSGKLTQLDQYLEKNIKAQDGIYTASQMEDAYTVVFKDELIADSQKGIREQTIIDIEKAASGGSTLDKIPSDGGSKSGKLDIDKLDQEKINDLTEAECEQLLAGIE